MTREYLYESGLDDAKFFQALQKMDSDVDKITKSMEAKFARIQKSVSSAVTTPSVATGGAAGPSVASVDTQAIKEAELAERRRSNLVRENIAQERESRQRASLEERKAARVVANDLAQQRVEIRKLSEARRQAAAAEQRAAREGTRARGTGNKESLIGLAKQTAAWYLLIRAIQATARAAAKFFTDLLKESVNAAANIDSVGTSFEAIFAASGAGVGTAVLRDIREESKRLGVDLTGISRRILPLVDSVGQLEKIGELITSLSALDPLQGTQGALIAINEALAGDVISLRRRFEIPTQHISDLQKTKGLVDGLIEGLGQELDVRGLGFDILAETADITFKRINQRFLFLKEEFGTPILDELNEQFKVFLEFLEKNDTQITALVQSFGELVARVAELLGMGLNAFFDDQAIESAERFFVILEDIITTVESISGILSAGDAVSSFGKINDIAAQFAIQLKNAALLLAVLKAGIIAVATLAGGVGKVIQGELEFNELDDLVRQNEAFIKVQTEFNAILDDYGNISDEYAGATGRARQALEDKRRELEKNTDAERAAADAQLILANSTKRVEEAQAALADAMADVGNEIAEANQEFAQEQAEAIRDAEMERLDILRDFANKRVALARDNAREIAEIFRDHQRDIAAANLDLSREEQDIIREGVERIRQIEEESAQERIDIEEDFQRELEDIRRRFDFQAEEAIRANDAVALLRIRRQMQFELNEARVGRDEQVEDAEQTRQRELEEERQAQQQRREEARIAHQRELEDLQIALQTQLEERRISYAQDLQDLKIAEAEKLEEARRSLAQQLDELRRGHAERLREIQDGLADEVKAVEDAEAAKLRAVQLANELMAQAMADRIAAAAEAAQQMVQIAADAIAAMGTFDSPDFQSGGSIGSGSPDSPDFQSGGSIGGSGFTDPQGNPIASPFGPGGSQSITTSSAPGQSSASITPPLLMPPTSTSSKTINNFNNGRTADVNLNLVDPSTLSPTQLRIVQNLILQTMRDGLK